MEFKNFAHMKCVSGFWHNKLLAFKMKLRSTYLFWYGHLYKLQMKKAEKYNLAGNFDQANQIWMADKEQKGLHRKSFLFSHNYLFQSQAGSAELLFTIPIPKSLRMKVTLPIIYNYRRARFQLKVSTSWNKLEERNLDW